MGIREIVAGTLFAVLAVGGAGVTGLVSAAYPGHERLILWASVVLVALAVLGLALLLLSANSSKGSGAKFNQRHSGTGDNKMDFRR